MSTQQKLALIRFVVLIIMFGGGDAVIQLLGGTYDVRHFFVALATAAFGAGEQYYKSGQLLKDLGLQASQVGTDSPLAPPQTPVAVLPPTPKPPTV